MAELSVFVDESGSDDMRNRYFLLMIVLHQQDLSISHSISQYEHALAAKGLPLIPFHASPLIYGKDQYRNLEIEVRKQLLSSFRVMFRHLPITYIPFVFKTSEFKNAASLTKCMTQEIKAHIIENLSFYQRFDSVKIYYDGGQDMVSSALRSAYRETISHNALIFKPISAPEFCLAQAADYICTMEYTAIKFNENRSTPTDEKFFGKWGMFKKGILKEMRTKQFTHEASTI